MRKRYALSVLVWIAYLAILKTVWRWHYVHSDVVEVLGCDAGALATFFLLRDRSVVTAGSRRLRWAMRLGSALGLFGMSRWPIFIAVDAVTPVSSVLIFQARWHERGYDATLAQLWAASTSNLALTSAVLLTVLLATLTQLRRRARHGLARPIALTALFAGSTFAAAVGVLVTTALEGTEMARSALTVPLAAEASLFDNAYAEPAGLVVCVSGLAVAVVVTVLAGLEARDEAPPPSSVAAAGDDGLGGIDLD